MGMNVGGDKSGPMADINVTPMADIMIVLLIIFMVVTPLLQKGVDVALPQAGNTKERKDEPETITIAIRDDAATFLRGVQLGSRAELLPKLRELLDERAEGESLVYLKGDSKIAYSEIMDVMDIVREAGVEEVALIADPKVEG